MKHQGHLDGQHPRRKVGDIVGIVQSLRFEAIFVSNADHKERP